MKNKTINHSLNVLKFISIFAVVCIHCYPIQNIEIGTFLDGFFRFSVPVFFLISGFYSYYESNSKAMEKYKTRAIRLIKLMILSNAIYFSTFENINNLINHNFQCIVCHLNVKGIFDFLVLNNQISGHLWFIGALLYCYILLLILGKLEISPKKLYKLIPALLFINILFGEILKCTNIFFIPAEYYRNFFFEGLPFFMIGYLIHDKQDKIIPKISNKSILIAMILSYCFLIIEVLTINISTSLNIGSIFISILMFIWCVKNPDVSNLKVMEWIGGKLYAYIYILHFLVISTLTIKLNMPRTYFTPIIAFIITIMISLVLYFIIMNLKRVNQKFRSNFL